LITYYNPPRFHPNLLLLEHINSHLSPFIWGGGGFNSRINSLHPNIVNNQNSNGVLLSNFISESSSIILNDKSLTYFSFLSGSSPGVLDLFITDPTTASMTSLPIVHDDILRHMTTHGIHNLMIKNLPPSYLNYLLNIYNISLTKANIPQQWKKSVIKMLLKKWCASELSKQLWTN
jgi:hypothetical protein